MQKMVVLVFTSVADNGDGNKVGWVKDFDAKRFKVHTRH